MGDPLDFEGISQKVLSQKLKQLERDGLITRTAFATVPVTVEYRLTEMGHGFSETIDQFARWAEQNIQQVKLAQKKYDTSNT